MSSRPATAACAAYDAAVALLPLLRHSPDGQGGRNRPASECGLLPCQLVDAYTDVVVIGVLGALRGGRVAPAGK